MKQKVTQMKLYTLNMTNIEKLNIGQFNPTMKAIVKGMYKLQKTDPKPRTGQEILEYCVDNGIWKTTQDRAKYMTTWAYYVKRLKEEAQVLESGSTSNVEIEYLE